MSHLNISELLKRIPLFNFAGSSSATSRKLIAGGRSFNGIVSEVLTELFETCIANFTEGVLSFEVTSWSLAVSTTKGDVDSWRPVATRPSGAVTVTTPLNTTMSL